MRFATIVDIMGQFAHIHANASLREAMLALRSNVDPMEEP